MSSPPTTTGLALREPVLLWLTVAHGGGLVQTVHSRGGISIRLSDERWTHITEEHGELSGMRAEVLETIAHADRVYAGNVGELLAVKEVSAGKWLVVVYRELRDDGFVITAFLTRRIMALERRKQLWP